MKTDAGPGYKDKCSGNPLVCSCRSFQQKLWLTQNRKWIDQQRRGGNVGPQCSAPDTLSDRFLLTTKDAELCPLPSVSSFDIRNVTTSSVLISWDSQDSNMTGLKGFLLAYHRLDTNDVVKKFHVNPHVRMFRLNDLMDDSVYLVCVITQGSSYSEYATQDNYLFSEAIRLEEESQQLIPGRRSSGEEELSADIPSSNDTKYLITEPIVLNLDSASSRCNKIRTPLDPAKLNMVDNKQLSALIGCSSGLMIFFCIIISIVARPKKHKDDDIPVPPRANSLTESYKSPSFKSRSESLAADRSSYCNSQSSSLTRLNGGEGEVRGSRAGTLQRGRQGRQSPGRRPLAPQSSTESGPGPATRTSRQSSSELGTIRRTGNRRSGDYTSRTLDRREERRERRYKRGYEVTGSGEDCIPMIEYSNHSSPLQAHLTLPREQWRNNSQHYDHSASGEVYPPPQVHQENFIQRKYESLHHPR